jgi:HD-GYP domain-containing protein (c-di-GMP phosphodiesterase class II)
VLSNEAIGEILREVEAKDFSTAAHTWRVALYARAMAELGGAARENVERITLAAALHDVGKLDVPTEILQKPGRLTEAEFAIVRRHPETGYDRLIEMGVDDQTVLNLVRHHHERWDGLGYPDRLTGQQTPLIARHFAVIDTFDALTSVRPYRREVGAAAAEHALEELHAGAGTRYARDSVALFDDLYRTGRIGWVLEYFNDEADLPAWSVEQCDRASEDGPTA